jgi:hypothetical protein
LLHADDSLPEENAADILLCWIPQAYHFHSTIRPQFLPSLVLVFNTLSVWERLYHTGSILLSMSLYCGGALESSGICVGEAFGGTVINLAESLVNGHLVIVYA